MPFAVKMGLGGTGHLGCKAKTKRAQARFRERRRVLEGFPILTPFKSLEEVKEYLSGDLVVCLICGKSYKDVGKHIRMHGVKPDEYRARYGIPWTYGLCSRATSERYSEVVRGRMERGWKPDQMEGEDHSRMVNTPRRKKPHHLASNLKGYKREPRTEPNKKDLNMLEAVAVLTEVDGSAPSIRRVNDLADNHQDYKRMYSLVRMGLVELEKGASHNSRLVRLTEKGKEYI